MVIRVYRYARQHVEQAEKLLDELKGIRIELNKRAMRTENIYTDALTNADPYVPIAFMRSDNEFNRYRLRMEEKQNLVVVNLSFSLSFCAKLVSAMVHDEESEAWGYKVRIRNIIDRGIAIATDEAMDKVSLAPLASAIAKMESEIILNEVSNLILIKRHLMEFRTKIS